MPSGQKPATRKTVRKPARTRATEAAHARGMQNERAITRIKGQLEMIQKEMPAIRGSVGTGGRDIRKDVSKMLREVRRDVEKMNKAVRRDLERLQKELASTAKAHPSGARRRAAPPGRRTSTRRRGAG
jgi:gas vesicle protein